MVGGLRTGLTRGYCRWLNRGLAGWLGGRELGWLATRLASWLLSWFRSWLQTQEKNESMILSVSISKISAQLKHLKAGDLKQLKYLQRLDMVESKIARLDHFVLNLIYGLDSKLNNIYLFTRLHRWLSSGLICGVRRRLCSRIRSWLHCWLTGGSACGLG